MSSFVEELEFHDPSPDQSGVSETPVVKWKNIAANLFVGGEPMEHIARTLGMDVEEIHGFIHSPAGQDLTKQLMQESSAAFDNILEGSKVDNLMTLLRLRDGAKTDAVRLNAVKELNVLCGNVDPLSNLTPDQIKARFKQLKEEINQS